MGVGSDGTCTKCGSSDITPFGNCRPCRKQYNADYRAAKIAAKDPDWYAYRRRTTNNYTARLRDKAHALLGDRCACPGCPITRRVFLSIDHIDDDGAAHRKKFPNQQMLYRSIIDDPDATSKYQILCHNCNMAKSIEENHTCLTDAS